MKFIVLIFTFILVLNVNGHSQEVTDLRPLNLGNIEFTLYPNTADAEIKVQFLLPRDQVMEMYIIDPSGDLVGKVMNKQYLIAGVKTYDFDFPENADHGTYFIVIKSNEKSIIKKIEYLPKI